MNTKQWRLAPRTALCLAVLVAMAGCAHKPAPPPAPLAAQQPAPLAEAEPTEAKDILQRMAGFLAQAPRFSVNVQGEYDAVQASGQKIEFGETRKITVSRPKHLRVEAEHSDGEKHLVLYDGNELTAFTPSQNVYAQAHKTGDIDDAVVYFVKDLGMKLPLAMLLLSKLPEQLESRTQALDYVEKTSVHGVPTHHLAGRTETVDYQVWIAVGAQPLPLRVVLTYKNAQGQPQFRARFSDWNLSPDTQDSQFAFTPPEGARRISFLAQMPQVEWHGTTPPQPTGGKK